MSDDHSQPNITPLRRMQLLTIDQLFQAMTLAHKKEFRGYQIATMHLSNLLRKYMPIKMRDEVDGLYQHEKTMLKDIVDKQFTGERLSHEIYQAHQITADAVFSLCCQALTNSPIIEEMQITDIDTNMSWDELKKAVNTTRHTQAIGGKK